MKPSPFNGFCRLVSFSRALITLAAMPLGVAYSADLYWDNVGGTANDWGSVANWSTVVGGGTNPGAIPGGADVAIFSATSVTTGQTVNLNSGRSLLGMSFTSGQAHGLAGGGTNQVLTLAGSGITKSGTGAVTIGSATAGQQVALSLSANQNWTNNNNTGAISVLNGISASTAVNRALTLTGTSTAENRITGVISNNGGGVFSLNKTGAGLWVLGDTTTAVASSYSGGTIVSGGTLRVDTPVAAATYTHLGTGQVSVSGGATLHFLTGSTANVRTFANTMYLNGGRIYYQDGNTTLSGSMVLGGVNTFTGRWDGKNLTVSGAVSGSGGIVKNNDVVTGANELILSGNNVNWTSAATGGVTRVNTGALRLTNSGALGQTSTVLVESLGSPGAAQVAALRLSGNVNVGAGKTLILRNGGNSNARSYLVNVADNNTWAGDIVLENQSLQGLESLAGSLTVSGNVINSVTSPSSILFLRGSSGGNVTGNLLLGGGSIAKTDGGTWTVSSTGNTMSSIQVSTGGLVINNNNAIPVTAPLTLSQTSGGTGVVTINGGFSQEFASITNVAAGNGSNVIQGAGLLSTGTVQKTYTVNDGTAADDLTISTGIAGSGGFIKAGLGTLHLNGSTVEGSVVVDAGVLRGNAVLSGGLTVNAGGTLVPGSVTTLGTVTASTLALNSGTVAVNVGSNGSDQIVVTDAGGFTQSGTTQINITPNGGFATGSTFYPIFSYSGATPGTSGFSLGVLPGRVAGSIADNGSQIGLSLSNDRIIWTGAAANGNWDVNTTTNWETQSGAVATNFLSQDDVIFNNAGIGQNAIALSGTINPLRVEFAQTVGNTYTLVSGTLSGSGLMPLNQTGTGTTILRNVNSYTGATNITAGVLELDHDGGSLTGTSSVNVGAAGTLRLTADNNTFTFNRVLTGDGAVRVNPITDAAAGINAREVTLSAASPLYSGVITLESPANASSWRVFASPAALGGASVVVQNESQLYATSNITYTNPITLTGDGYNDSLGSIGALRFDGGVNWNGSVGVTGVAGNSGGTAYDARIGSNGGTNAINGVVSGGDINFWSYSTSAPTIRLTNANTYGDTIIGGADNVAVGGSITLVVGENAAVPTNTTATLGSGNVYLAAGNNATPHLALLRINRADGYTLGQSILSSATASAQLANGVRVDIDTPGSGVTVGANSIDLSDGTTGGALRVGVITSGSILNIGAGSVVDVGQIGIGDGTNLAGTVNQSGGTVDVLQMVRLGHFGGNTSTYNLSGGSLNLTGAPSSEPSAGGETTGNGNGVLYVGVDGTGIFNHSAGTLNAAAVVLDNRGTSAGVDQYNLSGGTLELRTGYGLVGRNADPVVTLSGGTIRNTGSGVDVAINVPTMTTSGTTTLDTNGASNRFTLMGNIGGSGTLLTSGGGDIEFEPDGNTTRTSVSTGTGTQVISAILAGSSDLVKLGGGTTTLSGANTLTGTTTVAAGRLNLTGSLAASALTIENPGVVLGEGTAASITFGTDPSDQPILLVDPQTPGALTSTGVLTVSGLVDVELSSVPTTSGPVKILNHGGTSATPANFILFNAASFRPATFEVNVNDVTLEFEKLNLVWDGTSTTWEIAGADDDWNGGTPENFFNADSVTFDDTLIGANQVITISENVSPSSVVFNNSTYSYGLSGTAGVIGTTSIVKNGTNSVTLGGNNTFTGGLVINNGTVVVGSATGLGQNNGQITINAGGQLDYNGVSITPSGRNYTVTIAGSGVDGTGAIRNDTAGINENARILHLVLSDDATIGAFGGTLPNGNRIDVGLGGTITGNGNTLTKVGDAMVAMRGTATDISYIVSAGTLRGENDNLALGSTGVQVNTGATLDSWGDRNFNVPVTFQDGALLTSSSGTGTWSGPVTLEGAVNMGGGATAIIAQGMSQTGGGLFTKSGGGTLVLPVANTIDRKFAVTGGILRIGTDAALGAVPGSATADAITLSGGGRIQGGTTTGNDLTIDSNRGVTLSSGDGGFHVWTGFTLNYGGAITGSGNFTKTDGGALVYSGASTHTGQTSFSAGTVTLNGASFVGAGTLNLTGGVVMNVTNNSSYSTTGILNLQTTTLNISSGTLTADKLVTANQSTTSTVINQSGGTVNVTGTDNSNSNTASFLFGHWGSGGTTSIYNMSGGILNSLGANLSLGWDSTNVAFVQTGGTVNLRGVNLGNSRNNPAVYDLRGGRVNLGVGGISANSSKVMGLGGGVVGAFANWSSSQAMELTNIGGSVTVNTLDSQDNTTARTITLSGVLSGMGGLIKDEAGTLILSAANTFTGATRVDGGTLRIQGTHRNSSGILVNAGAVLETAATNVFTVDHGTAMAASRVITVDGGTWNMVSGDARIGNVTLNNGGTWTSNVNTDWGILLGNNSGGVSTVSVGGTGVSTMNGAGSIRLQGIQNFDISDATGSAATDLVVSMQLRANGNSGGAAGGINKLGGGTMDLQGSNDFAGGATVTAGTLLVNGAITGTGAVNVLNTSTLGGNGEIAGAVSIASTAFLSPGNSIGTDLGLASLDLDGTLEIEWDSTVMPTVDFFEVLGALTLDAGSTVSFTNLGAGSLTAGPTNGFVFAQYGSLTGTFGNVVGLPSGFSIDYNYGGLNQIAIIPEPSVSLLGAMGALGLAWRRRRVVVGAR